MQTLPEAWKDVLPRDVQRAIPDEKDLGIYQPKNTFRAFALRPELVRVVLLGMDPYPGEGVPEGLAFSVSSPPPPASLRNILREWSDDLGREIPASPSLLPWAQEGVFLLNAALTVRPGEAGSHLHLWRDFSTGVIQYLSDRVFLVFGRQAAELTQDLPYTVKTPHPSPLSAWRGFFGSRPFSQTNDMLLSLGREPLSWDLP